MFYFRHEVPDRIGCFHGVGWFGGLLHDYRQSRLEKNYLLHWELLRIFKSTKEQKETTCCSKICLTIKKKHRTDVCLRKASSLQELSRIEIREKQD